LAQEKEKWTQETLEAELIRPRRPTTPAVIRGQRG
jgi:hypothetical protein